MSSNGRNSAPCQGHRSHQGRPNSAQAPPAGQAGPAWPPGAHQGARRSMHKDPDRKPCSLHLHEGLSRTLARSPSVAGASTSSTSASSGPGSPGAAARRASSRTARAAPRAVSRSSSGGGQATAGRRYCRNAACHSHRPKPLYHIAVHHVTRERCGGSGGRWAVAGRQLCRV